MESKVKETAKTEKKKIGPYDVLLEELADGSLRLLACPHVGNNRLEVLLLMNRNEFEESLTSGVDTRPVLDKLVDIVTQQCVPPGRFLIADRAYQAGSVYDDYEWEEIDICGTHKFLTTALMDANTAGLAGFPTSKPDSLTNNNNMPSAPKDTSAENKKRFRRSSLLRRSVSESFVRNVQAAEGGRGAFRASEFGKKKAPNRRHSSFMMGRRQKAPSKAERLEDLDILFNYEQTSLIPNHVGNNRLRVLLSLHNEKYQKSDEKEQTSSLQEWIRTVTQFWGGRFLRQEEENSNAYEVLDANQAELALHSVMSELSNSADEIGSITSTGKKVMAVDSVASKSMDVHHMRSAAVQSLQKRKKRQGLASRLRRLATNAITRNTSNRSDTDANGLQQSFPKTSSVPGFTRDSSSLPGFTRDNNSMPEFVRDGSVPGFSRAENTSVPAFSADGGVTSLPTSPTPVDNYDSQQQRQRRSLSITLPRFMMGRASLRRSKNIAADGVSRDLRQSLEADDRDFGPEMFGEH